jgi:SEC-C motif
MSDKKHNNGRGHVHGPGCDHDHSHSHSHGDSPDPHLPRSEAERAAVASVAALVSKAGYDPNDGESFKQGAAALMVAQMIAVSAGLTDRADETRTAEGGKVGRNDPCPCGSGKKYKKCCLGQQEPVQGQPGAAPPVSSEFAGVRPGMIPRMNAEAMQADTVTLGGLFLRDPTLAAVRLNAVRVAKYLEPHSSRVPEDLAERDRWVAERAREFVVSEHKLEGEEADVVCVLRGLKTSILGAAANCDQDNELRALALGLLLHSSWAPDLEMPHPLEALLFRLALRDTAVEQQTRARLIHTLADENSGLSAKLASGSPEGARQWQEAFDKLPEAQRVELLQTAQRFHDSVAEAVASGSFAVPLPLVSVLPLVIETVHVARDADDESGRDKAREVAMRHAKAGLSSEDRTMYVTLCDEWLESPENQNDEQAESVRYARRLASVGASSLEPLLLLAFLEYNRVSQLSGEPTPNPAEGLELDNATFLEVYGSFLAERGDRKLALRTWQLCRFAGPIPDSVQSLIDSLV